MASDQHVGQLADRVVADQVFGEFDDVECHRDSDLCSKGKNLNEEQT